MKKTLISSTLGFSLLAGGSTAAVGQEIPVVQDATPAPEEVIVGEIIVTATKAPQRIRNVPISISAITAEGLGKLGGDKFNEFLTGVAGVAIQDLGAQQTNVIIRGISTTPDGLSTVASYFDELPYGGANSGLQIRAIDVERIEVLRGPQAILYGADSLSGTLRVIPVRPNLVDTEFGANAAISSIKESKGLSYDTSAFINLPIITDKLAIRAAAFTEKENGFVDNIRLRNKVGNFRSYGGRLSVSIKPSDAMDILGQYVHQRNKTDGNSNYRPILSRSDLSRGQFQIDREAESSDRRVNLFGLTVGAEIGDLKLTSVTSRRDLDIKGEGDRSFNSVAVGLPFIPIISISTSKTSSFTQEIRLASSNDKDFSWVFGAFYQKTRTMSRQESIFGDDSIAPRRSIFDQTVNITARSQDVSVFGELKYNVTPLLNIAVGTRYTWFDLSSAAIVTIPDVTDTLGFSARSKPKSLNPQFTLTFKPDTNSTYFVRAAKGFRTPRIQFPTGSACSAPTLKPDSVYNYEIGTKLRLADGAVNLNASAYYIDWRGIPIAVTPPGCQPTEILLVNAGDGRSYGLEAEITAKISESIQFNSSVTLSKSKIGKVPPTFTGAVSGEELPGNANLRITGGISYYKPITDTLDASVDLTAIYVGPSKVFQSGDFFDQFAPDTGFFPGTAIDGVNTSALRDPGAGDYALVNLSAGLTYKNYSITLFANNLFNSRARSAFFLPSDQDISGEAPFSLGQPRTIGLQFGVKL